MNPTLQQLHARKSTRAFTGQPISPEHKAAILEAAVQAPTHKSVYMNFPCSIIYNKQKVETIQMSIN